MSDVQSQLTTIQTALSDAQKAVDQAVTDMTNPAPTLADNVLSAVLPVIEAAGYVAPSEESSESEGTSIPVSVESN